MLSSSLVKAIEEVNSKLPNIKYDIRCESVGYSLWIKGVEDKWYLSSAIPVGGNALLVRAFLMGVLHGQLDGSSF